MLIVLIMIKLTFEVLWLSLYCIKLMTKLVSHIAITNKQAQFLGAQYLSGGRKTAPSAP